METPLSTDGVEWSELDGLEKVPDVNKNKVAVIQPATTKNKPVRRTGTRNAGQQALSLSSKELTDTNCSRYIDMSLGHKE
jgi:hypothetical protein